MTIYFDEDNMPDEWTQSTMQKAAEYALEYEGRNLDTELSVSFVDLDEIHQLNLQYRNVDRPTDVLSFPMFEDENLGDVVICREKAKEQAEEFGHSYERELIYLFTHSVFHLLGYDHETEEEKQEMRAGEEAVMKKLGITRGETK